MTATLPAIVARSAAVLGQGAALAAVLTPEQFTAVAPGTVASSVGAHLRHCIEFYRTLLATLASGRVDYDLRPRDARLETEPLHAMLQLQALARSLAEQVQGRLDQPLRVRHDYTEARDEDWSDSSVRRELHFLFSHTVHHYALIAAQLRQIGIPVADDFGVSPATLRFRQVCGLASAQAVAS